MSGWVPQRSIARSMNEVSRERMAASPTAD